MARLGDVRHDRRFHKADPYPHDHVCDIQHCQRVGHTVEYPTQQEGRVHYYHGPLAAEKLDDRTGNDATEGLTDVSDASWKI